MSSGIEPAHFLIKVIKVLKLCVPTKFVVLNSLFLPKLEKVLKTCKQN